MAATKGTAIVDFGAYPPGSHEASIAVTGQAGIVAGSYVEAWIEVAASADHDADDHLYADFDVRIPRSLVVAGTGFTIKCFKRDGGQAYLWGRYNLNWVWST